MNIKKRVAEPVDTPQAVAEAIQLFQRCGWEDDAEWLAQLALEVFACDRSLDTLDHLAAQRLNVVARCAQSAMPLARDSRLLRAFVRLCDPRGDGKAFFRLVAGGGSDPGPNEIVITPELRRRVAARFAAAPVAPPDFAKALVESGWPAGCDDAANVSFAVRCQASDRLTLQKHEQPEVFAVIELLTEVAALDFAKVVDIGSVMADAVARWPADFEPDGPRQAATWHPFTARVDSPRRFEPWLLALGPKALGPLLATLQSAPDDAGFAAIALGVRCSIERWLALGVGHWTYFDRAGALLGDAAMPWFRAIHDRAVRAGATSCVPLRRAWLWFAQCAFEASCPPDRRRPDTADALQLEAVLRAAAEDLAALRKLLRRAAPAPSGDGERSAAAEFVAHQDHLGVCLGLLFRFGGIWRGLKPMLLAWRDLPVPGVSSDLRYWGEAGLPTQPPQPWSDLVAWPINLFHFHVRHEQAEDPRLDALRGEIAKYCLERLRDRLKPEQRRTGVPLVNDAMVERSPEWRYCLVRAVAALGIDPDGRGHRTLHMSASRDPDEEVREAARDAYQRMRRDVGLPADVSPRRAVLSALWWMRQAHLLALRIDVDLDGAQRTRIKELTRTKEIERAETRDRASAD